MSRTFAHRPANVVIDEMSPVFPDPNLSPRARFYEWAQSIPWHKMTGAREREFNKIARRERRHERHAARAALREGEYDLPLKSVNFKKDKSRDGGYVY